MRQISYQIIQSLSFFLIAVYSFGQLETGNKAPEIQITNWVLPASQPVNLTGKYIVIDFWGTWCAPCLAAMPHMDSLQNKFRDREEIAFLTMSDEPVERIKFALQRFPTQTYVVTDTTGITQENFQVLSIPVTFLIDNQGILQWQGHPEKLTEGMIMDLLQGRDMAKYRTEVTSVRFTAVPSHSGGQKLTQDSLYRKFNKLLGKKEVVNYFELDTSIVSNMQAAWRFAKNDTFNYMGLGSALTDFFAGLLNVSTTQVHLPHSLSEKRINYLFKLQKTDAEHEGSKILLANFLEFLKLEETRKIENLPYLNFTISDSAKLNQHRSPGKSNSSNTSFSDSIIGFRNCTLDNIFETISEMLGIRVQSGVAVKNEDGYYITIINSSLEALKASLSEYGISIEEKTEPAPVYYFVKKTKM